MAMRSCLAVVGGSLDVFTFSLFRFSLGKIDPYHWLIAR
jgi:hypothetical protein